MPDINIPLVLEVERSLVRQVWQGSEVAVPVRREVQNDADTWFTILTSVNGDEKDVRMLRRMKSQLRPIMREAEAVDACKRKQVGVLTVSEEGLRFLKGLVDKPPEIQTQRGAVKMQFTGTMQETVADFLDFYETRPDQKADKEQGQEAAKAE